MVYSRRANLTLQQCSNCFSDQHLMNNYACPGIKEWEVYCQEFEERKRKAREVPAAIDEDEDDDEDGVGSEDKKEDVEKLLAEVAEKSEENVKLRSAFEEKERKETHLTVENDKMKERIAYLETKEKESSEDNQECVNLRRKNVELVEEIERLKVGEDMELMRMENERLMKEIEQLKVRASESDTSTDSDKVKEMEEEIKVLKEREQALNDEKEQLKKDEAAKVKEAHQRESILAATLEKSTELDNMLDGVLNAGTLNIIEDDPLLSFEDMRAGSETSGTGEDDTDILTEEDTDKENDHPLKRQRESAESRKEPQKKMCEDEKFFDCSNDDAGNGVGEIDVHIPVIVASGAPLLLRNSEGESGMDTGGGFPVPPPIPPRPPSWAKGEQREEPFPLSLPQRPCSRRVRLSATSEQGNGNSLRSSRRSSSEGLIQPAPVPLYRRESSTSVTGFNTESQRWEIKRDGQGPNIDN